MHVRRLTVISTLMIYCQRPVFLFLQLLVSFSKNTPMKYTKTKAKKNNNKKNKQKKNKKKKNKKKKKKQTKKTKGVYLSAVESFVKSGI